MFTPIGPITAIRGSPVSHRIILLRWNRHAAILLPPASSLQKYCSQDALRDRKWSTTRLGYRSHAIITAVPEGLASGHLDQIALDYSCLFRLVSLSFICRCLSVSSCVYLPMFYKHECLKLRDTIRLVKDISNRWEQR